MSRKRPQLRGEQIVRLLERLGYHLVGKKGGSHRKHRKKITRKPRSPDRYYLFGRTDSGRYLFVVFQYKGLGIIRPISARDMTPQEHAFYERP